ncbi:MAG TPA: TonB-dependent receptor [Anaeromyxobacter sp.]
MRSWSRLPWGVRALALAFPLALAPPLLARAEDAPAPPRPGDELPQAAEQIVILGRRPRGQVARDPTAAATVIEAERFAGEAKGVAELLATAPGVAVNDYGGLGHAATVSIRGATADGVLVLLDGIPLNTAFGGGVDLASIPRHWIERIEIVRGTEGAHYGAGALGGVVNVITRRPRGSAWSGEASGGSFETFGASADRSVPLGGASLLVAASGETSGGAFPFRYPENPDDPYPTYVAQLRANDATSRAGALAKVEAAMGATRLDALAQLSGGRRELPGWPYRLTPGDWQEDARAALSTRLTRPFAGDRVLLAARLTGRFDWLASRTGLALSSHRGGAAVLEGEARLQHANGRLTLAIEAQEEALRSEALGGSLSRRTVAISLAEDLYLADDRLRVGPAVRAERNGGFGGVSSKLGGSIRLAGPLALRASGGTSFRAPSFAELNLQQALVVPNPDLVPEEGVGGDAALVLDEGPLFASVGAHATLYRALIYYQQASLGLVKPFNAGKVLVRGLEVEVATAPSPALLGLSASASYTLLATEILRGVEGTLGNWVPHRARHRLYARLAVAPGPAGAHLEAHWVGRQFDDDRNLVAIPAALTFSAGASLRLARSPELAVALEARNLLDDRTLQDGFGNPLPGRIVLVSLRAGSAATEGRLP